MERRAIHRDAQYSRLRLLGILYAADGTPLEFGDIMHVVDRLPRGIWNYGEKSVTRQLNDQTERGAVVTSGAMGGKVAYGLTPEGERHYELSFADPYRHMGSLGLHAHIELAMYSDPAIAAENTRRLASKVIDQALGAEDLSELARKISTLDS